MSRIIVLTTCTDRDGTEKHVRMFNSMGNAKKFIASYIALLREVSDHGDGVDTVRTDGRTFFEDNLPGYETRYTIELFDLAKKDNWNLIKDTQW